MGTHTYTLDSYSCQVFLVFLYEWANQSDFALPDGWIWKHKQNPKAVVTKLLANADNAKIQYGDPHSGGLVRCFFVTEPPVSPFSLFFCTTHQHIEKSYSICFMLLLVVLKPSSRWRNGLPYSEKTSSNTSIQELLVVFVCPSTIRGFPGKERMAWH